MKMKKWKFWSLIGGALALLVAAILLVVYALGQIAGTDSKDSASSTESTSVTATATADTASLLDQHCMHAENVSLDDAKTVSLSWANIAYCWDSTQDTMMTDGQLRTKALDTDKYAATIVRPERSALSSQFMEAKKINGYSVVDVTPLAFDNPAAEDGATASAEQPTEYYAWHIRWSWRGDNGQTVDGGYTSVIVTVVQGDDGKWRVDDVWNGVTELTK